MRNLARAFDGHRHDVGETLMSRVNVSQPDVTLLLDMDGVIQEATLSNAVSDEGVEKWLGRPWDETVADHGGDKVKRIIADARTSGVSAFRQVTQRFPSGLELPIEYTTVRLGGRGGLLAIGKSLQAVAELQSRLVEAQQTMERDYWKLREVETRYRLLFDASTEAVLLINASTLRIVEANPAAIRALGLASERPEEMAGRELIPRLAEDEREAFQAMLNRVQDQGKAPGMLMHLGRGREPWLIRATLMTAAPGAVFLLQLSPAGAFQSEAEEPDSPSIEGLVDRLPDGFVVIDSEGAIVRANQAFLSLVQLGAEGSVVGERLGRWLARPGADIKVLLANVNRHRLVRMFSTTIHGELGSDTEVEISAAGSSDENPRFIGLIIRDVSRRLAQPGEDDRLGATLRSLAEQIGKSSLQQLVRHTVGLVEQHYIEAALELTNGNRTATAELLGLSRQSLYAKLDRYRLDKGSQAGP